MTATFPVSGEDGPLAEAMTEGIGVLHRSEGRDAVRGACQIRAALEPQNGYHAPFVPFGPVRAAIARGLRAVAADGHPLAGQLTAMADEMDPRPASVATAEPEPQPEPRALPRAPVPPPALPAAP